MERYGICMLAMIPVRNEPGHKSELINQLIFGDLVAILEEQDNWLKIAGISDGYPGWINGNSITLIEETDFNKLEEASPWIICDPLVKIKHVDTSEVFFIPGGSSIFGFKEDDFTFNILNNWFQFLEKPKLNNIRYGGNIGKLAYKYIHTPYLWGGRTAMGVDCSGFSQIIYKMLNINIPRDASQQVGKGNIINFLAETKEGDLAFFDNDEGKIIHVGILLSSSEIIHASGMVRIDAVDQTGIYDRSRKNYSHKLRIIKRLIV
ncbi:MAG: C40 family peptidase [Bacteroidales bacterium]|nr:C40 family peptidase [Bacteroidales bacterium]